MLLNGKKSTTGDTYLGKYRSIHLLGEGGMGRVYLGQELSSGRHVVIKVMHDHVADNQRFRQAFQRETRLMMRFRHPYAVALYEASAEQERHPCIVMEYVAGVTLAALVEKYGRLSPDQVGPLLGQLCQVLQAAHDNGIIHRDLTPVNVMVVHPDSPHQTVKVMDFGLARMGAGPYIPLEKLTGDSQSIGGGTPDYVPPEQVRGEQVDHRGDLYSVGVMLFKVLTGYLPFEQATTTPEILRAHVELSPPRFADFHLNHLPRGVEDLVQACLSKHPKDRPQSALELAERYEKAVGRKIILGSPVPAVLLPGGSEERIDPRTVLDHLQAWMPEPIAIVKLRGFVHDMGGEVVDSEPGRIRFRLPDPATQPQQQAGFLAILGLGKKAGKPAESNLLELRLEKDQANPNLLLIAVMMRPEQRPERLLHPDWRQWSQLVCRELRGYLMSR